MKAGYGSKEDIQDLFDEYLPQFEDFMNSHAGKKPVTGAAFLTPHALHPNFMLPSLSDPDNLFQFEPAH